MTLIDRAAEKAELAALLDRGRPQMALLFGRRRVGKSYLLDRVWPEHQVFYFTAAETTSAQNRETVIAELATWTGESLSKEDYPTWRTVFRLLFDMKSPEPLVVVLDEFQFVGTDAQELGSIASELNAAWEQRRPVRPFVLVLSGSAVGPLEALASGGAPLYGRFAWKHRLQPFGYEHAHEMTSFADSRDRVRCYAAFGGTPRYLAAVDQSQSVDANIARLLLHPRGEVRGLIETALLQERGLRDVAKYQAVLRAIGTGHTTLSQIKNRTGLQTDADTAVRRLIDTLITLGYVRADRNVGAAANAPYRYRIEDPAFAFYYEFVTRFEATLARTDAMTVWSQHVAPHFDTYVGHIFERIAEQAYYRLQSAKSLPLTRKWGCWEGLDREREPLEIDIVAPLLDKRVLTGGVKWNRQPLDARWHFQHMEMLNRIKRAGVSWAVAATDDASPLLWVAAGGFTKEFATALRNARTDVQLWDLDDLYAKPT